MQDYSAIREKVNYQPFSDVKNPVILRNDCQVDFVESTHQDNSPNRIYIGSTYTIYDFDNDKIVDWVFTKSKGTHNKLQKITCSDGAVKYLDYDILEKQIYIMEPDKTSVERIGCNDDFGFVAPNRSDNLFRYKLFYHQTDIHDENTYTYQYTLKFFDADKNRFGDDIYMKAACNETIKATNYLPKEKGGDGYVWFITGERHDYPKRSKYFLNRINPETNKLEEKLVTYDGVYGDEIYSWIDSKTWNHKLVYKVLDNFDDELLIERDHSTIDGSTMYLKDFLFVNRTTFEERPLTSSDYMYVGKAGGKIWFHDINEGLVAFDEVTLVQTKGTESKDLADNYVFSFTIEGDVIYLYKEEREFDDTYTMITAYDAVENKIISTRRLNNAQLTPVEK